MTDNRLSSDFLQVFDVIVLVFLESGEKEFLDLILILSRLLALRFLLQFEFDLKFDLKFD